MKTCALPLSGISRVLYRLTAYIAGIALLTACQPVPATPPSAPEKVSIAYMNVALSSLFHIAHLHDYFRHEGLDVTAHPHISGKNALQSLIDGKTDLAITADTPFVLAVLNGDSLSLLATIATSHRYNLILARKDRGITKPADLRGKTIGVATGTTAHFFLHAFLTTQDMSSKDVVIRDYPAGEPIRTAIISGKVDAISYWTNAAKVVEQALGDSAILFYDETLYSDNACLIAQKDFVRSRPDTIRKVLRALVRAEEFIRQHPDEARQKAAAFTGIGQDVFDGAWRTIAFRTSLEQSVLVSLEAQTQWAQQEHLTRRMDMPNYLDNIFVDGLLSVNPQAMTIIR